MTMTKKGLIGAVAAALAATTAAAPAEAQYRYRDRGGIDLGDIVAGVAIIGGIAVAVDALSGNDRYDRRYTRGYDPRYGSDYRYGARNAAIQACGYEAQRYGQRVRITDVDRRDGLYRIRGQVEVRDYDRWNRYRGGYDRERFTCHADGSRVYDFRV